MIACNLLVRALRWLAFASWPGSRPFTAAISSIASVVTASARRTATAVMWLGSLASKPSFTTRPTTYSPARSAVNCGATAVGSVMAAALPARALTRLQEKVSGSPFASELALPSSRTTSPSRTDLFTPAEATGLTLLKLTARVSWALATQGSETTSCSR